MPNKLHDIFNVLTFIGTGEHLPASGTPGDVFATPEGKSYVYINHDWEEMGTVTTMENVDLTPAENYIYDGVLYLN